MSQNALVSSHTTLLGMKAICIYAGKSENTIRSLVKFHNFPANKIGGSWTSDTKLIDAWTRKHLEVQFPATFNMACSSL